MKTELYWLDESWPGRLGIGPRPRGGDWLDDEVRAWQSAGVDVVVSLLTEDETADLDLVKEPELCQAHCIVFRSWPIEDRGVPIYRKATFDFLKELERSLAQGKRIAIHCRQGIGRSALMAAALLVMHGHGPEPAFASIAGTRGCSVPETAEQMSWVAEFARDFAAPLSKR